MKREVPEPEPWFGDPVDQCVLVIEIEHWYIIAPVGAHWYTRLERENLLTDIYSTPWHRN